MTERKITEGDYLTEKGNTIGRVAASGGGSSGNFAEFRFHNSRLNGVDGVGRLYIVTRHRSPIIASHSFMKSVNREILLSFWKVHILHHANEEPIHGQWILTELRRHGYEISPGTLYPLLNRMQRLGWLKCKSDSEGGRRARKNYRLTKDGRKILGLIREQIKELHEEVVLEAEHHKP